MPDTPTDFMALTGGENLLVLATAPGEETRCCGALIAEACFRGRPPFVAVLTDGAGPSDTEAAAQERRTRDAVARLGVPPDWLLLLGLHDGTAPMAGRKFEAVVTAVALLMWRRDCNLLVAPAPHGPAPDQAACHAVAAAVAARAGTGQFAFRVAGHAPGLGLHSARALACRQAALALHAPMPAHDEAYFR